MLSTDQIKQSNLLSEVIAKDVKIGRNGPAEWTACCPFHEEKTPSFNINDSKGVYYCFGCGASGDVINYIQDTRGVSFKEACQILGGEIALQDFQPKAYIGSIPNVYDNYIQIFPVPEKVDKIIIGKPISIYNPKREKWSSFTPSMVFEYKDKSGKLIGYVIRQELNSGGKITPTITWCSFPDGSENWVLKTFPPKRSLYRIEKIGGNEKQIIICEGEKAADACAKLLKINAVSWAGGVNSVKFADWGQLKGRKIGIWPDADEAGKKAAEEIAEELLKVGVAEIKIIYPPKDIEKGFDAADALALGWDRKQAIDWFKNYVTGYDLKKAKKKIKIANKLTEQDRFRILGYNKGNYFYLPDRSQQLVTLAASGHNKLNLLQLAPLNWWEANFGGAKAKVDWDMVANALLDASSKCGIFVPSVAVRGIGAWLDEGKKVLHLGDRVLVDGTEYFPCATPTKHVYEAGVGIDLKDAEPLNNLESSKLIDICENLQWHNQLSGKLLAGWCVIAPICGALKWRSHIWITGQAGAGKSTVKEEIIHKMLGSIGLFVEGGSTEAGIRQSLLKDALPVVFDEIEGEDRRTKEMVAAVLRLARVGSSGGSIIKGSGGNAGVSGFTTRSMFCFLSVNVNISEYADDTRITRLVLKKDKSADATKKFNDLLQSIHFNLTEEYAAGMIQRTIKNLDVLMANIKTFTDAGMSAFSEKRFSDQLAPMLAGAYLCKSEEKITLANAKEFLAGHDWKDHSAQEVTKEEDKLLEYLLTKKLRFSIANGDHFESTIGESILFVTGENNYQVPHYTRELGRTGIKIEGDYFIVANSSTPIFKMLIDTPWSRSWGNQLKNIPGAESCEYVYFSPGLRSRGTRVPIKYIRE